MNQISNRAVPSVELLSSVAEDSISRSFQCKGSDEADIFFGRYFSVMISGDIPLYSGISSDIILERMQDNESSLMQAASARGASSDVASISDVRFLFIVEL